MRSRVVAGAAVLSVLLLAGCSSSDDPGDDPGGAESTAPPSSTASGTPSPSQSASPDVEPAAGPELVVSDLDGVAVLRLHAPTEGDWEVQPGGAAASAVLDDGRLVRIGARTVPAVDGLDLDDYVKITRDTVRAVGIKVERVDDRVVDGVTGYGAVGLDDRGWNYYYGAVYGDTQVELSFELTEDGAASEALIDAVLASAEWV